MDPKLARCFEQSMQGYYVAVEHELTDHEKHFGWSPIFQLYRAGYEYLGMSSYSRGSIAFENLYWVF